jgi:YVTN family beta-propeller protein
VSVVALGTGTVTATVDVPPAPSGAVFSPDGTRVYVSSRAGAVSVIDPAVGALLRTVALGGQPNDAALTPDGRLLFVPRRTDDTVSVVSAASLALVADIPVGRKPVAVDISTDGSRAYIANYGADTVSVVDVPSRQVVGSAAVGDGPTDVAVAPDDASRAYVANRDAGSVSLVVGTAATATFPGVARPGAVAVAADGSTLYVTKSDDDVVAELDAATGAVRSELPAGDGPIGMAMSGDGSRGVVANAYSQTATFLSLAPQAAPRRGTSIRRDSGTLAGSVATDTAAATSLRCYYARTYDAAAAGPNGLAGSVAAVPAYVQPGAAVPVGCPIAGLSAGTTYYYVVAARDADGWGWLRRPQAFRTAPAKPRQLNAVARRRALVWRWEERSDATYYEARLRGGGTSTRWSRTESLKIRFGRLKPATRYQVEVRAGNEAGRGAARVSRARTR